MESNQGGKLPWIGQSGGSSEQSHLGSSPDHKHKGQRNEVYKTVETDTKDGEQSQYVCKGGQQAESGGSLKAGG